MKKAKDVKEFVEKVDQSKKTNPKDLSSDQDLTIAVMNLISIEEHLIFSGAKTGKTSFYDLIDDVREIRKNMMLRLIPSYEGEGWCISKHLLASSMRIMEVGTKQQNLGNKQDAYNLYNQAYDLYCLFWGLNMNMLNLDDVKWVEDSMKDVQKITERAAEYITPTVTGAATAKAAAPVAAADEPAGGSAMSKMKAWVKKAVDCCIE
jgi:hypothetical protein